MTLGQYLERNSISAAALAKRLGCTPEAVRLWARGERIPRAAMVAKINDATIGAVGPADWYAEAA
jgi:transcriptional regulator with XRE-family HTH domain